MGFEPGIFTLQILCKCGMNHIKYNQIRVEERGREKSREERRDRRETDTAR